MLWSPVLAWEAFLALCEDQAFRRIILDDAPTVLGRDRWSTSQLIPWSSALVGDHQGVETVSDSQTRMRGRVTRAALTEAALAVLDSGNNKAARNEAVELISRLLPAAPSLEQPSLA